MLRIDLIIILQFVLITNVKAQKIIESTTFEWAAGACCAKGQDYHVTFNLEEKHEKIEGIQYILKEAVGPVFGQAYLVNSDDDSTTFHVLLRTSTNQFGEKIISENQRENTPKFDGEAYIELKIDGELFQIIISEFKFLGIKAYP